MKIRIIGGGPAGLYFALLMKRADPAHDITVIERNPPEATFGWGVVFSAETLTELRDTDYETFLAIDRSIVRWNAIDIHYRGEVVRSSGQGFSAISRKVLLGLLQERCRQLGVELRFNEEVGDMAGFSGADLIVAADGVNSTARKLFEPAFRPTLAVHPTKYAWFGSDLVFDAFTFIFKETPHGVFQVHGYPFDEATSTFIVECTEDTWRRAGMEEAGEEEGLRFAEDLFADDLGGHRLYSNRSIWLNFVTVKNESWHHDNIVLVGDAAHTAHFTIGSGTKLAMEGAGALAKAFLAHPGDLEAAFAEYEMERQPPVERFQTAASESASYFENVARYFDFQPLQFGFHLLTRSGRISRNSLEARDPGMVAAVDEWFTAQARHGATGGGLAAPTPSQTPLDLGAVTVPNRLVQTVVAADEAGDGVIDETDAGRLLAAAAKGAGLIVTDMTAVAPEGRVTPGSPGLYDEAHLAPWREAVAAVQAASPARVGVRIGHAGRRGSMEPRAGGLDRPLRTGNWELYAPSALPHTERGQVPKEIDRSQMNRIAEGFVVAAGLGVDAGFDVLFVDMSAGYLLAGFLSPLSNRRRDDYGDSLEARLRYPLEVVEAVRATWPEDRPLAVRLCASDWGSRGLTAGEGVSIAKELGSRGVDLIHVTAGHTTAHGTPEYRRLFLVPLSDQVRNEAGVATMVGGAITTLDQVNTVLAAGRADLCVLDTALYAAPSRRGREQTA